MEQRESEKGLQIYFDLQDLVENSLACLLILRSDSSNKAAFLKLLQTVQRIKIAVDNLSMFRVFEYISEVESLLRVLQRGEITLTEEILFSLYQSIESLSRIVKNLPQKDVNFQ